MGQFDPKNNIMQITNTQHHPTSFFLCRTSRENRDIELLVIIIVNNPDRELCLWWFIMVNRPDCVAFSRLSSSRTRDLSHCTHLSLRTLVSCFFRLDSLHCSLFFRVSTCSRLRDTSFTKLSSTSRVISNMAALNTVSMTPDSWDWNECTTSDIMTSMWMGEKP